MQTVALLDQQQPITGQKPAKPRVIGRKVKHAIGLLVSGECREIKAAAERAGLTRSHLSRMLSEPHIEAFIAQSTRKTIAAGQMRAGARLLQLLDASSEHVSLDAAKHTLGIAGIKPADEALIVNNINVLPGYMVDLNPTLTIEHQPDHTGSTDLVSPDDGSNDR